MVLVLASALALSACSSSDPSPVASGGSAAPVTLEVWSYGADGAQGGFKSLTQGLDSAFEKANPGVTVDHKYYPLDGYDTKIQAAVAASNAPDVAFQYDDRSWESTVALDSLLTGELKDQVSIATGAVQQAKDGQIHAIPWGIYAGVFLYNKSLFTKAGLDPEKPPTTMDEFLSTCDKFNAAGIVPFDYGFKDQYTLMRLVASIGAQTGTDFPGWGQRKTPFTVDWYKSATADLLTMVKRGCFGPEPWLKDSNVVADPNFRSGKTAITYPINTFTVSDYEKTIGKGNLGLFGQPLATGSTAASPTIEADPANAMQIFKQSEHQDAAWKYIAFYLSAESQTKAWDAIAQIPNNRATKASTTEPVFTKLLALASAPGVQPGYWPVGNVEQDAYGRATVGVTSGQTSVDDFLAAMQKVRDQQAAGG